MLTREAMQVCDNLNPNLAIDSYTDTDNDFTADDFRKTKRYYMQCFIVHCFHFVVFFKYLFHMNTPCCHNLVKTVSYH